MADEPKKRQPIRFADLREDIRLAIEGEFRRLNAENLSGTDLRTCYCQAFRILAETLYPSTVGLEEDTFEDLVELTAEIANKIGLRRPSLIGSWMESIMRSNERLRRPSPWRLDGTMSAGRYEYSARGSEATSSDSDLKEIFAGVEDWKGTRKAFTKYLQPEIERVRADVLMLRARAQSSGVAKPDSEMSAISPEVRPINESTGILHRGIVEEAMGRGDSGRERRSTEQSLKLSAAEGKKARNTLLQSLKQCWPRVLPQERQLPVRDFSEFIPSFCTYAQDLFDAYMNASELANIEFLRHVEDIQKAILHRIAPAPLLGLSWGLEIGEFEAIVEWTRKGWVAKTQTPGKWVWHQPATDLESGKIMALNEAARRAGLGPAEVEGVREKVEWRDRGYPPKDLHSLFEADLREGPGEWERYVAISWSRFDHPKKEILRSRVMRQFVEVMREIEGHSRLTASLLNGLEERIDHWDAAVEVAKQTPAEHAHHVSATTTEIHAGANAKPERPRNTSAAELVVGSPTDTAAESEELDWKRRRIERGVRLTTATERWQPIAKRIVPFTWVHAAAGVDHKDAYGWKSGKLSDTSIMAQNIERVLLQPNPPSQPEKR